MALRRKQEKREGEREAGKEGEGGKKEGSSYRRKAVLE